MNLRQILLASTVTLTALPGRAETQASTVITTAINPGSGPSSFWPEVPAGGEGWFYIAGYCKVVDVSSLSNLSASDHGAPVWIDGGAQWADYRLNASSKFDGDVTLTTCCPPLSNIPGANLCTEAGATVQAVSRQYGKNGEVDAVTATCTDEWGRTYTDSINVECVGSNTANGSAQWIVSGSDTPSACTPDAYDTGCYAGCSSTSTGIRYDSCGHPSPYNCYGGACPPPPAPPPPPATETHCNPVHYCCGPGVCYTDCSGGSACTLVLHTGCTQSCVGSTWHTSTAPCTACNCYEVHTSANGAQRRVESGPGCCEQNNNCY